MSLSLSSIDVLCNFNKQYACIAPLQAVLDLITDIELVHYPSPWQQTLLIGLKTVDLSQK